MKLKLDKDGFLYGTTIEGDVELAMSANSRVMGNVFVGEVSVMSTGKITPRTIPLFWWNFVKGRIIFGGKLYVRENVATQREEAINLGGEVR